MNSTTRIDSITTRRVERLAFQLCPELTHANCHAPPSITTCPVTGHGFHEVTRPWSRLNGTPLRVLITGAAGAIAYSLVFLIGNGNMFGSNQQVILQLLDIPQMSEALKGLHMELLDCALPLVKGIIVTTDLKEAFMGAEVAIFCGAFPRQKGMERKDLLKKNAAIFKEQGMALNEWASRDVKVLVVGNPANTNAYILIKNAPSLPRQNFTALTRLDHNRTLNQISERLKVPVEDIHNVIIWGNHSATQYPDVNQAYVENYPTHGVRCPVRTAINDDGWLHGEFITSVQQRGAEVIKARKLSSAASAAHAIGCHMRDWLMGTKQGEIVSVGLLSQGWYGIPADIVYSFPVQCSEGRWNVVSGLQLDSFSKERMSITTNELLEEKSDAMQFLA